MATFRITTEDGDILITEDGSPIRSEPPPLNYRPFVSWGAYGAATATKRAHFFASWGIFDPEAGIPEPAAIIGGSEIPFTLELL